MDNYTPAEEKRRQCILKAQELRDNGCSIKEIVKILGRDYKTIRKYLDADPDKTCVGENRHRSELEGYKSYILSWINEGCTQSVIAKRLKESGYEGTSTNARMYVSNLAKRHGLELSKYSNYSTEKGKEKKKLNADFITRKGIFNHLWMDISLTEDHHKYLWEQYPILKEIETCIREFREFFNKKNMPMLYIFIEKYSQSEIKEIASFAKGLKRDIDAVENAVASTLSNGFVEGTNSKVKTIKKSMYGRCGIELLSAKLMYRKS